MMEMIPEPIEIIESVEDFARAASPKRAVSPTVANKRPPVMKAQVGKVVAYHATQKQPVPVPKQITVIATFKPIFVAPEKTPDTTTPVPEEQIITTSTPSDFLQYVTYAPTEMPVV